MFQFAALILLANVSIYCCQAPTVTLPGLGTVVGTWWQSLSGRDFAAFRGIQYGTVNKRFQAATAAHPWTGEFLATENGPICKQIVTTATQTTVLGQKQCLNLNVYVPKVSSDSGQKLSVIVFLSGNFFDSGTASSDTYGPKLLLDYDVVLVVPNYRVGFFGFLSTGDAASPGNYGLLDQQLALKWVQDNIGAFGGDKDQVTLMGQGSGAASVFFHLFAPSSQGLFGAATIQSGSGVCPWAFQPTPMEVTRSLGLKLGCGDTEAAALVECLRNCSSEDLALATPDYLFEIAPVVESNGEHADGAGAGAFITENPYVLLKEGRFHQVPVITGLVRHELTMKYFNMFQNQFHTTKETIESELVPTLLRKFLGDDFLRVEDQLVQKVLDKYYSYINWSNTMEIDRSAIMTFNDGMFNACNNLTIDLLVAHDVPVYSYVLEYASKTMSMAVFYGRALVANGQDLLYLFDSRTLFDMYNLTATADDTVFVRLFDALWINFVHYRNPTPSWPTNWSPTLARDGGYLSINSELSIQYKFIEDRIPLWRDILLKYWQFYANRN